MNYLSFSRRTDHKKYDKNNEIVKKEKKKLAELIDTLMNEKNITAKGNLKNITGLCSQNNILLTKDVISIDEVWVNKPKGMLRILSEGERRGELCEGWHM